MNTIRIDGLVFDYTTCRDEDGTTRLESVSIDGQDISEIISPVWWDRIEDRVKRDVEDDHKQAAIEAELYKLEAYCL